MRVLLVTSWGNACGIAEHSALLKAAVEAAGPGIEVVPDARVLDPSVLFDHYCVIRPPHDCGLTHVDLIHLNHHDALHSRWTPEHVARLTALGYPVPVLVTYHDTRAGTPDAPNSDKLKAFAEVASSVVVHEPVEDLKAIVWRQGVPAPATWPADYTPRFGVYGWRDGFGILYAHSWKAFPQQPVLGTVGFHFPWKNYDELARLTAEEGWALVLLANNATEEDEARWRAANPSILVVREFLPQPVVINYLAGCDATIFYYTCQNNGTSAAIRQGLAARKPVIALRSCRQFRDLLALDPPRTRQVGPSGVCWVDDWTDVRDVLQDVMPHPWQAEVTTRAHADSWVGCGKQYAQLYRLLVQGL